MGGYICGRSRSSSGLRLPVRREDSITEGMGCSEVVGRGTEVSREERPVFTERTIQNGLRES